MYLVKVFDKNSEGAVCSFECNSLTESYDNEVRRKSLTFRVDQNLDSLISSLSPMEGVEIAKIAVYFDEKEIIAYTAYSVYSRASIEYPEGNPAEVQGIVNFAV